VARSYGLSYVCSIGALGLLPLIPRQKEETRDRLKTWPSRERYGKGAIGMVACAWIYAVTLNLLAMSPTYSCLRIVGGAGC